MTSADTIQAAGGVVWRPAPDGDAEVLVVHRPRYDDWGWPKGKADRRDTDPEATARREVLEETGLTCRLGDALGAVHYVSKGRPKTVRYWAMTVEDGAFIPNDEVDDIAWLSPDQARGRLSYDVDHEVLDRFLAARPR